MSEKCPPTMDTHLSIFSDDCTSSMLDRLSYAKEQERFIEKHYGITFEPTVEGQFTKATKDENGVKVSAGAIFDDHNWTAPLGSDHPQF